MRLILPGVWITAGLLAGALPYARTATALRRAALLTLVMLAGALAASLALATPALTILASVAIGMAAPRLVRLQRSARMFAMAGRETPAPPAIRAAAAHPMVATPIQATAYTTATIGWLTAELAPVVVVALALVLVLTFSGHAVRHQRLSAAAVVPAADRHAHDILDVAAYRPPVGARDSESGGVSAVDPHDLLNQAGSDGPGHRAFLQIGRAAVVVPVVPALAAPGVLYVQQLQDRASGLEPSVEPARRRRAALGRQLQQQAAQ